MKQRVRIRAGTLLQWSWRPHTLGKLDDWELPKGAEFKYTRTGLSPRRTLDQLVTSRIIVTCVPRVCLNSVLPPTRISCYLQVTDYELLTGADERTRTADLLITRRPSGHGENEALQAVGHRRRLRAKASCSPNGARCYRVACLQVGQSSVGRILAPYRNCPEPGQFSVEVTSD